LARTDPAILAALGRPYHVDRRGGVRDGEAPTVERPVVDLGGDEPLFRYLRYWIEAGHRKAEVPLEGEALQALDRLDETLRRPDLHAEFSLHAGDILWLNNRWLLHSRTAFQDHDEPERKRHLVRLWLERTV
jgi:alpha-ketoglutarate-dependent taurine dioxygenase